MPLSRSDLHPYQRRMVAAIRARRSCALWAEPGLGKTAATLTAVADMLHDFEINQVLVIAPLRVARTVWAEEAREWEHLARLTFAKVLGTAAQRLAALRTPADIHVINRENVVWLTKQLGEGEWPWDVVVIDESTAFSSHDAARFKVLRRRRPFLGQVVELTGTPATKGLIKLWAQMYLLDGGERLGKTISGFRDRWFERDFTGFQYAPAAGANEAIRGRVADICTSLLESDYLVMPDLIDHRIPVDMPAHAWAQYRKLETEFLVRLKEVDISSPTTMALTNKLLQFANGAVYHDDAGSWVSAHDAKLDALESLLDELSGTPLLLFYNYRSDLARIRARFSKAVAMDDVKDPEARWNAGEIGLLCGHPASMGHGLNLQKGPGNHICWFGWPWSLELYLQARKRVWRQGQKQHVFEHAIYVKGSMEETVRARLDGHYRTQRELMEALRESVGRRDD